jgi:hypothetical protein
MSQGTKGKGASLKYLTLELVNQDWESYVVTTVCVCVCECAVGKHICVCVYVSVCVY